MVPVFLPQIVQCPVFRILNEVKLSGLRLYMLLPLCFGFTFRTGLWCHPYFRRNSWRYCPYPYSWLLHHKGPNKGTERIVRVLGRAGMVVKFDNKIPQTRNIASCYVGIWSVKDGRRNPCKESGDRTGVRTRERDETSDWDHHHMMSALTKIAIERQFAKTMVKELVHREENEWTPCSMVWKVLRGLG